MYKLKPAAFSAIKKQLLISMLPIFIIILGGGLFLSLRGNSAESGSTLYVIVPLMIAIFGFSMFNTLRRQKRAWNSYSLTIDEDYISREQDLHTPISIAKKDIVAIDENEKVYHVRTADKFTSIIIPKAIEHQEEVAEKLSQLSPITAIPMKKNRQLLNIGLLIGVILLFYVCLSTANPFVAIVTGLLLLGGLGYSLYVTMQAKQLEARIRRMAWVGLIPLMVIGLKVWMAFMDVLQ